MNRRLGRNIVFFKISLKREYTQLALRVFSLQFNFSKYNVPPASTDSLHNKTLHHGQYHKTRKHKFPPRVDHGFFKTLLEQKS